MIKNILVEYEEANQKYNVFINDEYLGKHYTLEEEIKEIPKTIEVYKNNK